MMTKFLVNLLFRLLYYKFDNLDDFSRIKAYRKMQDGQIVRLLKARFTDHYTAHLHANDKEQRWIYKGRVLELQDMLNSIENVDKMLLNIEKRRKRLEVREKVLNPIKRKLIGFVKHKNKPKSE